MSSVTGITETEDLTLFIRERMQEYDPSVDTTTGSSYYNTVLQPLLDRLGPDPYDTPIREFCLGRLAVEYPDMVLQDGEPIDDLVVKPMQVLLEPFRRQIQQVSNNQSLEDPDILNEREADALGGNFFVRRRPGGLSVGVARLYFSAPQAAIVTPNNAVFDGSGQRFFPVENQAITADNMLFNVEDNLYYMDIVVRAEEEGASYNVDYNTLIGIEEFDAAVKVTNKAAFEEGDDKETTEEYIERVENSLTEKSLVTFRGITARLTDVFETIRLIQVIGHGDAEMNRDLLVGEPSSPAPYAFFLGSTGRIELSGDTNDGITNSGTGTFDDPDATFQTDGVAAGFVLRILSGTDAGDYPITGTPLETQIEVTGSFIDTAGGLSYVITDPTSSGPHIDIGTDSGNILLSDGTIKTTFPLAETRIGDIITYADPATGVTSQHTVTSTDNYAVRVTPDIQGDLTNVVLMVGRPASSITISEIPGGILQPDDNGELVVESGEIHLGGAVDVFVRAGAPVERNIVIEGVLDGDPLHFGVDLESFGERANEFVHITRTITDLALRPSTDRFGNAVTDHLLILIEGGEALPLTGDQNDGSVTLDSNVFVDADAFFDTDGVAPGHIIILQSKKFEVVDVISDTELELSETFGATASGITYAIYTNDAPWIPSEDDIGRYIEILPSGAPGTLGLLEILTIESREYYLDGAEAKECIRITVDVAENHYDPGNAFTLGSSALFDVDYRLVESVSIKSRVRDRDGTRTITGSYKTGSDLGAGVGAAVGDSVVIETGDDAGIYSIRRILSWLNSSDTLILDRDLTKNHTPVGNGDGSGLRYRIADELNVDLVTPKVTKIPLGNIFAGDDLITVAGSAQVSVGSSTNFLLAGVEVGDTLEILAGDDKGSYSVVSVTGTTLTVDSELQNTAPSLDFSVYLQFAGIDRPMVRVKEVELLDSSSQPTGIKIPYGDVIDARALGVFSNRAEGNQQESFTGVTQLGTGSLEIRLYDAEVDFVAEGAVPGWRLNVLNTENEGRYTILSVGSGDGLPSDNHIEVVPAASGGTEFIERTSAVHYTIGLPSSGVARLYFQDPTTVEIDTGLSGGRINYSEVGTPKEYHFSEVDGYRIVPAAGEEDEVSRDIRVVRSYETSVGSGDWETVLELTDTTAPGVFEQELVVGDLVEVNEQIPFRDSGGTSFRHLGIFGSPAGVRTVAGSNRVTVPSNSLIDFTAMDSIYPLAGQILYIDAGPDEGPYVIEEVVDSKTLRLNQVMTGTTETIIHQESSGLRDATLIPGASTIVLEDTTDNPGTQIGNYVTIFESTRGDIDGTFEVKSIPAASQVELDMSPTEYVDVDDVTAPQLVPFGIGLFTWVNTTGEDNVAHAFRIYKTVPIQAEITKVATQRDDLSLEGVGDISGTPRINFEDASATFVTNGVVAGDQIEILAGPSVGVYPIASVTGETTLEIVNNAQLEFPTSGSSNPYKIWSGLHGSRTMVTVGEFESDDGLVPDGEMMPFKILRPGVFRVSSTEMEENLDGGFYYVDIQVESLGSGDEFNLDRLDRMVIGSGVRVDGYTHSVVNNNLTFSSFEQVSLDFDRRFLPVGNSDSPDNMTEISGRNLKVVYDNSSTTKLVHDLMRSDTERPVNANPLARHFLPSYVFVQLYYRGGPSDSDIGPVLEDYINNLGALDELEVSDLEAFISRRDADSIDHPIVLAVITHDIDRTLVVNRTESRLGGELDVPYNGTGRISCFFATLGEGLIVEKRS